MDLSAVRQTKQVQDVCLAAWGVRLVRASQRICSRVRTICPLRDCAVHVPVQAHQRAEAQDTLHRNNVVVRSSWP
jgi:hypothetical protein